MDEIVESAVNVETQMIIHDLHSKYMNYVSWFRKVNPKYKDAVVVRNVCCYASIVFLCWLSVVLSNTQMIMAVTIGYNVSWYHAMIVSIPIIAIIAFVVYRIITNIAVSACQLLSLKRHLDKIMFNMELLLDEVVEEELTEETRRYLNREWKKIQKMMENKKFVAYMEEYDIASIKVGAIIPANIV